MCENVTDIKQDQIQVSKFGSSELSSLQYTDQKGISVELLNCTKFFITKERPTAICDYLNVCYNSNINKLGLSSAKLRLR